MAKCVCVLMNETGHASSSGSDGIMGVLKLSQASEDAPTVIEGVLKGLTVGKHGISVCTYGDLSEGATSCGQIFNPFGKLHGSPQDTVQDQRMVGDLGNIVVVGKDAANSEGGGDSADNSGEPSTTITTVTSNSNGTCTVKIIDPVVKLIGPHSIVGRSLVVYAGEDDGGRGGHESSLSTGNAGPRVASGVVGISK